ncbi:hypothetical protein KM043_017294 [Ampulex compressa]|nr:hypothetical protein KM043_017294 [Ampulex compressa]
MLELGQSQLFSPTSRLRFKRANREAVEPMRLSVRSAHLVRERLADGRQAEGALSALQSVRGVRRVAAKSHE